MKPLRSYLLDTIAAYQRCHDDRTTADGFRLFIDHNTELSSRRNLAGHVTGSALVWHRASDRVLRVHHATLNCWVFSAGGHIDDGEMPWQCAVRELREETGITALPLFGDAALPMPLIMACHPIRANVKKGEPAHWHYDMVYLFEVAEIPELNADPSEITEFAWVPVADVTPATQSPVDLGQQMHESGL